MLTSRAKRLVIAACALALGASVLSGCATAGASGPVLGISIGFANNTWNQALIHEVDTAVGNLQARHEVADVKVENANNDVSSQVSQVQDMILNRVSAILIQPTSTAGLNGVITSAQRAHIPVLVFAEGPVTSTVPYELESDFSGGQEQRIEYLLKQMHGRGNVLSIRGTAGTGADAGFEHGTQDALRKYPGIKVVNTLYGDWDDSISEDAVQKALPGLPPVQGIIDQGGEAYGALQAFAADGRGVPAVEGGNRTNFLQWWQQQHAKTGFTTISSEMDPGIGAAAVYEGYQLATGKTVPKRVNFPYLTIPQNQLDAYIKSSEGIGCAFTDPALDYVVSHLSAWSCGSKADCGWVQ
ncbi:substrate-binding domain-containing protein [Amycolatopsis sp. NPDC051903]|uniref:substrate-binding domain-containing protein n=1 Tax=Amycolatopsis sp. NPDC051903 TaxID=3363936 RepID=UPI0037B6CC56